MIRQVTYQFFLILLFTSSFGNPDSLQIWQEQKNYQQIVEYTLEEQEIPFHSGVYHAGSFAAYNSGQFAEAILLAEKVLLSKPSHRQAKEIIKKSRQKQSIKQIQDVWGNRVQILMSKINPSILNLIAMLIALLAVVLILVYFKSKKKAAWTIVLSISLWFVTILSLFISYQRYIEIKEGRYAIVMEKSFIYEGPDEISEKTIPLLSGTKVKKIDKSSNWFYIESEDGIRGWVPEAYIDLIRLP